MVRKKIIQKLRILCLKRSMNGHEEERVKYEKDERKKQALSRLEHLKEYLDLQIWKNEVKKK